MLSRLSTAGRSFNDLASSKLGCYSFLKVSRGSKEISEFIDKKESVPIRGWSYTEKEGKVWDWKGSFLGAARSVEFRELGNNESCKSQYVQRFYSLYAFILKL